ncbi:MAG: glycosyltransferase family 2 protein [Acidobacteriaceae bacterium]|nr:glycosyltransferase family 2 protein [Acidobacteriaceae bacterium]
MNDLPTISVALCTYNGARYLEEQLASILAQTRPPDELVWADDGSTDATSSLAQAFAARAGFPVSILPARSRLGSTRNFERALRHCRGDLIALSDQDDRWQPQRLARSAAALESTPDAVLLFSDGLIIDEHSLPLSGSLWQRFGFVGERHDRFIRGDYSLLSRERFITGATTMLRRSALAAALPIPPAWVHDAWLGTVLSFQGKLIALDEPLIDYRIHAQQQVGADSRWQRHASRNAAAHWARIHTERLQADALEDHLRRYPPKLRTELLAIHQERARFLRLRDTLPAGRLARTIPLLRQWTGYARHAGGVASLMKDWGLPRREPT